MYETDEMIQECNVATLGHVNFLLFGVPETQGTSHEVIRVVRRWWVKVYWTIFRWTLENNISQTKNWNPNRQ